MLLIQVLEVYGILQHIDCSDSQCEIRLFIKKVFLIVQISVLSVGLFAIPMFPLFRSPLSPKIMIKFISLLPAPVVSLFEDNFYSI